MTKGNDFENPLNKAVQMGTIGTKAIKPEETTSQTQAPEEKKPASQKETKSRPGNTADPAKQIGKKQQTIYLPPALTRTLKHRAVDLDTDISSVVQTALEEYFDRLNISH